MEWVAWNIDYGTGNMEGPCGCRLPFTYEGIRQAQEHECEKRDNGTAAR